MSRTTFLQILDCSFHSKFTGPTDASSNNSVIYLQYSENPIVNRAESTPEGILIAIGMPITSREMILDIFRAIPLPMPPNLTSDPAAAMVWKPETPLIAISHNHKEHALLTPDQLEGCKGPDDAAICQHSFATTRKRDSRLANLFFHTADEAAQVCQTDNIKLPKVETARNLGYGRWLITRSDDAYHMNILPQSTTSSLNRVKGCKVCIITLDCATELKSDSLTLKSDRASCNATGAQRLDLQLDPPLYAFRPQLTAFTDINAAYDQLQKQSSVFPKVATPMLRPLQELKPVLHPNQHLYPHSTTTPSSTTSTYRRDNTSFQQPSSRCWFRLWFRFCFTTAHELQPRSGRGEQLAQLAKRRTPTLHHNM